MPKQYQSKSSAAAKPKTLVVILIPIAVVTIIVWLSIGNFATQNVNAAWAASFFTALNSYRASNSSSPLSLCPSLNAFARERFNAASQDYQISHYNFTPDLDAFDFAQNLSNYSLNQAEDILLPGFKTPSDFFAYIIKNASTYNPYLINATAQYYGYYSGTANAYLTGASCTAPPAPPGVDLGQYYRSHDCNSSIATTPWLVVELSDRCPVLQSPPANFTEFKHSFDAAPRVAVYSVDIKDNYSATVFCASDIVDAVSRSIRLRNTTDYYALNGTGCTYSLGGLSHDIMWPLTGENGTATGTISNCINKGRNEPAIYINYSLSNTTVIKSNDLYVSGSGALLTDCGIARQLGGFPR